MNQYISGVFGGALVLCILMLNFPKDKACAVSVKQGNVTHVTVGAYDE